MTIKVRVLPINKEFEINKKKVKVKELVKQLGFQLDNSVVMKNNSPLLEEEYVYSGEEIVILLAMSGG